MTNLNQQILKFDYEQNFKDQDFYVSNSNEHSFRLLNSWPKWDKNFINLIGEKFSGKSHLINIFLSKNRGIKINSEDINNDFLQKIKIYENIIVEDLTEKINENLLFSLINIIDQNNKFPWSLFLFIQPAREIFLFTSSFFNSLHLCVLYLLN